jgi:hypothetical protein
VSVDDQPAMQLTYAPRVSPAPLTASIQGRDPTLGSLEVVVTNSGVSDLKVTSVTFEVPVGIPNSVNGPTLTPTTSGVQATSSDKENWSVSGPR